MAFLWVGCVHNRHHLLHIVQGLRYLIEHEAIKTAFGFHYSRRVKIYMLIITVGFNAANDAPGGLRLSSGGGNFGADQGIEQSALANIGQTNKSDGGYIRCL